MSSICSIRRSRWNAERKKRLTMTQTPVTLCKRKGICLTEVWPISKVNGKLLSNGAPTFCATQNAWTRSALGTQHQTPLKSLLPIKSATKGSRKYVHMRLWTESGSVWLSITWLNCLLATQKRQIMSLSKIWTDLQRLNSTKKSLRSQARTRMSNALYLLWSNFSEPSFKAQNLPQTTANLPHSTSLYKW